MASRIVESRKASSARMVELAPPGVALRHMLAEARREVEAETGEMQFEGTVTVSFQVIVND